MNKNKRLYYFLASVVLVGLGTFFYIFKFHSEGFFKKTETGLPYKVITKGKGPKPQDGEFIFFNMDCKTKKGEIVFSTADHNAPAVLQYVASNNQQKGESLQEAIGMLQKGDSMVFQINAKDLFHESLHYFASQYALKEDTKIFTQLTLENIMTEEQFKNWEAAQLAELQKKQQENTEKQFKKDTELLDHYLETNNIAARKTTSGLRYLIDKPGTGAKPSQGDKVKVHYTGYLLDGKVFDTSSEEVAKEHNIHNPLRPYQPIEFQLGIRHVIQGWDEGIGLLSKGTKAKLFIPSGLAYGEQGMGNEIPPNSVLVFEVELVDFEKKSIR